MAAVSIAQIVPPRLATLNLALIILRCCQSRCRFEDHELWHLHADGNSSSSSGAGSGGGANNIIYINRAQVCVL
jgi:hypothetical protein